MQLLIDAMDPIKIENAAFTIAEVKTILNSVIDRVYLSLLVIKNALRWDEIINKFPQYTQELSKADLQTLYDLHSDLVTGDLKDIFLYRNRLYVIEDIFMDDTPVTSSSKAYISGDAKTFRKISDANPAISSIYTQPDDISEFRTLAVNAIDDIPRPRFNDTELKWIYDFLKNRYQLGNRFEITMNSTLYACTSCRRYLIALKRLVENDGKIIEFKMIAHPMATDFEAVTTEILKIKS